MKIKGSITILSDQDGNIRIELEDHNSGVQFAEVALTAEGFVQAAMGRLANSECEIEICGLDKVGKEMEVDTINFSLGRDVPYSDRKALAAERAKEVCPLGWEPSTYFGAQNSFFTKDGEQWARCTIRRWV